MHAKANWFSPGLEKAWRTLQTSALSRRLKRWLWFGSTPSFE